MADEPRRRSRTEGWTDEERAADFDRRMITDYSTLPPEFLAELQRRMGAAAEEDRRRADEDRRAS